jgi:hypothetical protein
MTAWPARTGATRTGGIDLNKPRIRAALSAALALAAAPHGFTVTEFYRIPPEQARTIAGLPSLRDHVIAPIIAGIRSPRPGRKPACWTRSTVTTRLSASACKLSSTTSAPQPSRQQPHKQHFADRRNASS